jgi:uncharacterized protein (TIGR03437 family)
VGTVYPILDVRFSYAAERHAGEARVGNVGAFPSSNKSEMKVRPICEGSGNNSRCWLRFEYAFKDADITQEFVAAFFGLGRTGIDAANPDCASTRRVPLSNDLPFDLTDLMQNAQDDKVSIESLRLVLRPDGRNQTLTLRIELKDQNGRPKFMRVPLAPGSNPVTLNLPLADFRDPTPGPSQFDWKAVKEVACVIEERHDFDGVINPPMGGFDIELIGFVDENGPQLGVEAIANRSGRELIAEFARRDFETLLRLRDAKTGAVLDRTLFRDLIHWGATGWLLAALPAAVQQGWINADDARQRALQILQFVNQDALWGNESIGKIGNSIGVMYRFGGIDPQGPFGPLTGTRKLDVGDCNAVEASVIDTALFQFGAATCAAGFSSQDARDQEINRLVSNLLNRTRWNELVDSTTGQLQLAWKPVRDTTPPGYFATPASFGGFWASRDAQGRSPLTIDYWTDEGAMAAILAAGSEVASTSAEPWYRMIRTYGSGVGRDVVVTCPGSWFTYSFLTATYLDPNLGLDRGGEWGTIPVNWTQNAIRAFAAYQSLTPPVLPDAVELPDTTYLAQGLPDLSVPLSGCAAGFTGTHTPWSYQLALGLGGGTATQSLAKLQGLLRDRPEIWDPMFGFLDSFHPNLAEFPGRDRLTRQEGRWVQQSVWPLNKGGALLAQLNYLADGIVWKTANKHEVIRRGTANVFQQPCVGSNGRIGDPGGHDWWGIAVSRRLILITDGFQENLFVYDDCRSLVGTISFETIRQTIQRAGCGDIGNQPDRGPTGLRDAVAHPDGGWVVLFAWTGKDVLLRVQPGDQPDVFNLSVLSCNFGEAMIRGDESDNFPRIAVGGSPPVILVTVRSPLTANPPFDPGIAVVSMDGRLIHNIAQQARRYHGVAVAPGTNLLYLLDENGGIWSYANLHNNALRLEQLPSLGVSGRDLGYNQAWKTASPNLIAVGTDGSVYAMTLPSGPVVRLPPGDFLSNVWAVDFEQFLAVFARDETAWLDSDKCPTVSNINPTGGTVGSSITITGASFIGVNAVKFSNNVAADFKVVNDTTITATVPSGAVTGPIMISKTGCADVPTDRFTICPIIILNPVSLPSGTVGTSYNQSFTPSGGTAPYSCSVSANDLPPGLALTGCALSGMPYVVGAFTFNITATDANGCTVMRNYPLKIVGPLGAPGFLYVLKDNTSSNQLYGYTVDEMTGELTLLDGFPISTGGNGDGGSSFSERLTIDRKNHRLYAVNEGSKRVSAYAINLTTGALTSLPFSLINLDPGNLFNRNFFNIAVHPSGSPLVVGIGSNNQIASYRITDTEARPAPGSPYSMDFASPVSIAFSQDGNHVYTGGFSGSAFAGFRVNATTGELTALPGSLFESGMLFPRAYATDAARRLFMANLYGQMRVFTTRADDIPRSVSGNPFTSGLTQCMHGLIHPNGFYPVADSAGNRVGNYRISGSDSDTRLTPVTGSPFPAGGSGTNVLALSQAGMFLFAANSESRNLTTFRVNPATGVLTRLGTQPANTLGTSGGLSGLAYLSTDWEADVAPRTTRADGVVSIGDGVVSIIDWVRVGRFATGLDTPSPGIEFQRADCAPRDKKGDGEVTIIDWVQAGRYATGLDPVAPAGGPTIPMSTSSLTPSTRRAQANKSANTAAMSIVRAVNANLGSGQSRLLTLELDALGTENAVGFSLSFDPTEWRFVSAMTGSDARNAALIVNLKQVEIGRVGFALALPARQTLSAGTRQLVVARFAPRADGRGSGSSSMIGFADQPVAREVVDANAEPVPANYALSADAINARVASIVSAANFGGAELASESIVAAFGAGLATATQVATSLPLPTTLAGTRVLAPDSAGVERDAPLFFVAPAQVNYLIPVGTAAGAATVVITSGDGKVSTGVVQIAAVAPGLFSANASGQGVASGVALRVKADGTQTFEPIARFDQAQNRFVAAPIDLGPATDQVFLILYGTGFRNRSSLTAVACKIGGADAEVLFAGAAPGFVGLDQSNVRLPRSLAGRGEVNVVMTVDSKAVNMVRVAIR